MLSRVKFLIVISSTLLTALLVIGAVMGKDSSAEGAYRQLAVYTEVLQRIKSDYVEEPDVKRVTLGALQGLLESLDPQSCFLTAEQFKNYEKARPSEAGAMGLVLSKRYGLVVILAALAGSPAAKAGLQTWDLLEAVDGKTTRELPLPVIQTILAGAPGTSVKVVVRRSRRTEEPQEITLTRAAVTLPAVSHKLLADKVGYVDVDVLTAGKVQEVARAVRELAAQGAERLVLDLRSNSLGDPQDGVALANLFVGEGLLGYVSGQKYTRKDFQADARQAIWKQPLVVLTSRATSGAAEVAAAAILDRQRGQVVGEKTYGVAALQKTIPIEGGAAIILSVAKYYRPSGRAIQDGGINPTLQVTEAEAEIGPDEEPVPRPAGERPPEEDEVLKKAIEVVKGAALPAAA